MSREVFPRGELEKKKTAQASFILFPFLAAVQNGREEAERKQYVVFFPGEADFELRTQMMMQNTNNYRYLKFLRFQVTFEMEPQMQRLVLPFLLKAVEGRY